MKIVNANELAKLPENIIYSEYKPCILSEIIVKGKTLNEGNNSTKWPQWFDANINNVKDIDDDLKAGDSSLLEIQVFLRLFILEMCMNLKNYLLFRK